MNTPDVTRGENANSKRPLRKVDARLGLQSKIASNPRRGGLHQTTRSAQHRYRASRKYIEASHEMIELLVRGLFAIVGLRHEIGDRWRPSNFMNVSTISPRICVGTIKSC